MQILLTTLALLLLLAAPVPSAASIGGGAPLVTAGNPLQSHRRFGPFQTSAGAPDFAAAVDKELDQLLQKFLELPSADSNREFVFDLTRQPHIAGRENLTAQYVQEKFASFGLRSWMEHFDAPVNFPIEAKVQMVHPVEFNCSLTEAVYPEDPTSNDTSIPSFNGYSPNADVTAELVYVNYGMIEDYEELERLGVSLEGKIAIARYGGNFRGTKVQLAEKWGAVGVLIFSDPKDDGFVRGDVFPEGPWRPETGIQRGSAQYLMNCPGAPSKDRLQICGYGRGLLDEGVVAKYGPSRSRTTVADTDDPVRGVLMPSIPVQPLSWGDAKPLLEQMGGQPAPASWVGGLPIQYNLGPGPARVRIFINHDNAEKPMQNVFAEIKGSVRPNERIIIGAHRDAWVFGAVDPVSGTSVVLETARALSQLMKQHSWTPKRTLYVKSFGGEDGDGAPLTQMPAPPFNASTPTGFDVVLFANARLVRSVFASWDAEEYGLIGSVAFGERNADRLQRTTVAYLNLDSVVSGPNFGLSASPALGGLARWAASKVRDPATQKPLDQVWDGRVGVLGSGSDYTVFLHHLGIPSLDFGFSGVYGVYHSNYDSFFWADKFGDPGFRYHRVASQYSGALILALTEPPVLPFDLDFLVGSLREYLSAANESAIERGLQLDMTPIASAIASLEAGTQEWLLRMEQARREGWGFERASDINSVLFHLERGWLHRRGLPGRPWFKHVLQAPGIFLGYGSERFPGLKEAIRGDDVGLARQQISVISSRIRDVSDRFHEDKPALSRNTIVGLAIGGGFVILISLVCLGVWRKRQKQRAQHPRHVLAGDYSSLA